MYKTLKIKKLINPKRSPKPKITSVHRDKTRLTHLVCQSCQAKTSIKEISGIKI